jgi:hypothetical protein
MPNDDLLGVWMLHSFFFEDTKTGERHEPLGHDPAGTIIFHPGGRFFALMTPGDRPPPVTEAEQAAAFQKTVAYSGPYRLDPPNRLVTTVDIAWFQPWVGTDQIRYLTLNGDNLDITSAPLVMPRTDGQDATVFAVVSWKRDKALIRAADPIPSGAAN